MYTMHLPLLAPLCCCFLLAPMRTDWAVLTRLSLSFSRPSTRSMSESDALPVVMNIPRLPSGARSHWTSSRVSCLVSRGNSASLQILAVRKWPGSVALRVAAAVAVTTAGLAAVVLAAKVLAVIQASQVGVVSTGCAPLIGRMSASP